jgi:hypothetical protein
MSQIEPLNDIEECLESAQRGEVPSATFVQKLVESYLVFPSGQPVEDDGKGFQPLFLETDKGNFIVAFTHLERAKVYADRAPYALKIKAIDFLRRIHSGQGIVLNPGHSLGLEISSEGIRNIVRDFSKDAPDITDDEN